MNVFIRFYKVDAALFFQMRWLAHVLWGLSHLWATWQVGKKTNKKNHREPNDQPVRKCVLNNARRLWLGSIRQFSVICCRDEGRGSTGHVSAFVKESLISCGKTVSKCGLFSDTGWTAVLQISHSETVWHCSSCLRSLCVEGHLLDGFIVPHYASINSRLNYSNEHLFKCYD